MPFLSKAAPFLVIVAVIIIEALCRDASYSRYANPVNGSSANAWPKLQNPQNSPFYNHGSTTPWPALGQRWNRPSDNVPNWARPNQRQFLPNPGAPSTNSNAGSQYGQTAAPKGSQLSPTDEVRDDELREFSESLLSKDVNNAAKYVTINVQGRTTSRSDRDEAPLALLSISREAFNIPSVEKMLHLHNNYILESNVNEHYTPQEKNEENTLLDTILGTSVIQHTRNFLIQHGKIGRDPKEFRDTLSEIWFNMYSRGGGKIGSSGFEHVFVAEIKKGQVSGLHNWLYFNEEEKNKRANYLGYMKKIDLGDKGAILKYHFTFHGIDKPVGSMFIGTSPEFEIALYTTCFLLRADRICPLKLNGHRFIIRTFTYRYRGKNLIGSAFPEI